MNGVEPLVRSIDIVSELRSKDRSAPNRPSCTSTGQVAVV